MGLGRKEDQFFVVDVFDDPNGNLVLTLRRWMKGKKHWTYLTVSGPLDINFGDIVQAYPMSPDDPLSGYEMENFFERYELMRGPCLRFKLNVEPMPLELAAQLMDECPDNVAPGDFNEYNYFPT